MWQTAHVATRLKQMAQQQKVDLEVQIVPIVTLGDRVTDRPLSALGGTAVFTKEIENALLNNECDMAVHSLKDLATEMPDGLHIAAYLPREDPRDVFVSRDATSFDALPAGKMIGTSSLRRAAMVKNVRPDLEVVSLRGNVPTRLGAVGKEVADARPYDGPPLDGTIMAAAGLKRLGYQAHVTDYLSPARFLPAPGQGVIALQTRSDDAETSTFAEGLNCDRSQMAAVAERTFLNVVEGGCRLPIGAFSMFSGDAVELMGVILSLDGTRMVTGRQEGSDAVRVGKQLARELLQNGGQDILNEINQELK